MDDTTLALARVAEEGAAAAGPEAALWAITRTVPALLGDPAAALRPHAFREDPPPAIGAAATVFLRMPDGRYHLIAAPVNFAPEQYHELVAIELGHPGHVAQTRRPLLLQDTALHASFVKILQSFRAGSSMFAPLLWRGHYLGVLICAHAARGVFPNATWWRCRPSPAWARRCSWRMAGRPGWPGWIPLAGRCAAWGRSGRRARQVDSARCQRKPGRALNRPATPRRAPGCRCRP